MRTAANFIDTQDLGPDTIRAQMDLIRLLKQADKQNACPRLLEGASLGMIFEEASTRTRVSFEVAMTKLGGHALYLKPGEIHLGAKENIKDTAQVLSRMVDAVEIRAFKHATVTDFAEHAQGPAINGLTDYNPPTQAVCDGFTMTEHTDKPFSEVTVVFVGDATNVCTSTAQIVTMLGGTFIHARPEQYGIKAQWPTVLDEIAKNEERYGGRYFETENVEEAVVHAAFTYTGLWWWFRQEPESPDRVKAFKPRYQVNAELIARAPQHVKFMHCLPASRGVEATDEVMDSPQSIIFDQSEDPPPTEKGLLAWYITPHIEHPTPALRAYHEGRIESFLHDAVMA